MPQLQAVVYGQVQGVSFRAYAVERAHQLRLVGWIRNQADGSVETIAVGTVVQLGAFVAWLHRGSPAARVIQVKYTITEIETESFDDFNVRH